METERDHINVHYTQYAARVSYLHVIDQMAFFSSSPFLVRSGQWINTMASTTERFLQNFHIFLFVFSTAKIFSTLLHIIHYSLLLWWNVPWTGHFRYYRTHFRACKEWKKIALYGCVHVDGLQLWLVWVWLIAECVQKVVYHMYESFSFIKINWNFTNEMLINMHGVHGLVCSQQQCVPWNRLEGTPTR